MTENMEADLKAIRMELFPRLEDEAAMRIIERLEQVAAGEPQTEREAALHDQWRAFTCGYRLGIRPKDTQPKCEL